MDGSASSVPLKHPDRTTPDELIDRILGSGLRLPFPRGRYKETGCDLANEHSLIPLILEVHVFEVTGLHY